MYDLNWQEKDDCIARCRVQHNGFCVIVSLYYDSGHDWGLLRGKWTDTPSETTVLNPHFSEGSPYPYFEPVQSVDERVRVHTAEGWSTRDAYKLAIRDVQRVLDLVHNPALQGQYAVLVAARALKNEVSLASSAFFGIEVEPGKLKIYERDIVTYYAHKAIESACVHAQEKLMDLQGE